MDLQSLFWEMLSEMNNLNDWDIFGEEFIPLKKYVCGINGCSKSYSNRQNCYRHRQSSHTRTAKPKPSVDAHATTASWQREKDFILETFRTLYAKYGEHEAVNFLKENKKIAEHLLPMRKVIEDEISEAKESQVALETKLIEFKNSIPSDAGNLLEGFNSVLKLVKEENPESIKYLTQFSTVITMVIDHMSHFSEGVNPRFQETLALKKVLDEICTNNSNDSLEIIAPSPVSGNKRKASDKVDDQSEMTWLDFAASTLSNSGNSSPVTVEFDTRPRRSSSSNLPAKKKPKNNFSHMLEDLLAADAALLDTDSSSS